MNGKKNVIQMMAKRGRCQGKINMDRKEVFLAVMLWTMNDNQKHIKVDGD